MEAEEEKCTELNGVNAHIGIMGKADRKAKESSQKKS